MFSCPIIHFEVWSCEGLIRFLDLHGLIYFFIFLVLIMNVTDFFGFIDESDEFSRFDNENDEGEMNVNVFSTRFNIIDLFG